jgi:hypothetical protein
MCQSKRWMESQIETDLQNPASGARRRCDLGGFFRIPAHRLLAENVLA